MRCEQLTEQLLEGVGLDTAGQAHLAACESCRAVAEGTRRLDLAIQPALVVAPPSELQAQLVAVARREAAAQLATAAADANQNVFRAWWTELTGGLQPTFAYIVTMLAVSLAIWRVLAWFGSAEIIVGDVPVAIQLLLSTPAVAFLGAWPVDAQGILAWGLVGALTWLVAEGPEQEQSATT